MEQDLGIVGLQDTGSLRTFLLQKSLNGSVGACFVFEQDLGIVGLVDTGSLRTFLLQKSLNGSVGACFVFEQDLGIVGLQDRGILEPVSFTLDSMSPFPFGEGWGGAYDEHLMELF